MSFQRENSENRESGKSGVSVESAESVAAVENAANIENVAHVRRAAGVADAAGIENAANIKDVENAEIAKADACATGAEDAARVRPLNMELLAPAGGMEQLRAAVLFGADAVYLAADKFGMRARAANFKLEEIPEAVAVAHSAGAAVHVACNVLMNPADTDELPAFFRAVDAAGVDALIISDMGAFALAREHAPNVALHVSTQASVANAAAARAWHSLGAKRIVCAREMSLADIARMREDTPPDLEIEAFVHGAMCMAVSGRCLISSYLTGRSGNKGHCTQPCRWNYTLEEEKRPGVHFPVEEDGRGSFIMNAKDMNMLAHLRELEAAGVSSVKIEGRNKKAFYVASVVNAYRRVLDGEPASLVASELEAVSHRPYGTGFYFGEAEQAPDYDGYEQETMHVADVVACEPAPTGGYHVFTRCRNRYCEGDVVELLMPRRPVREIAVRNLTWLPDAEEAFSPLGGESGHLAPAWLPDAEEGLAPPLPEPVAVANRSCNIYRMDADEFVEPGSFVRVRVFRRSARSGLLSGSRLDPR